jgi:hypothetical protein
MHDRATGPFTIRRYRGGDWQPSPPAVALEFVTTCTGWHALRAWEQSVRERPPEQPGRLRATQRAAG